MQYVAITTTDPDEIARLLRKALDALEFGTLETAETLVWLALEEFQP